MKIVSTGKFPEMPAGQVYDEPQDMADHLIEQGYAVAEEDWTPHIVTADDLVNNPTLAEEGIKEGDEIEIGEPLTAEEVAELKEKEEIIEVKEKANEVVPVKKKRGRPAGQTPPIDLSTKS